MLQNTFINIFTHAYIYSSIFKALNCIYTNHGDCLELIDELGSGASETLILSLPTGRQALYYGTNIKTERKQVIALSFKRSAFSVLFPKCLQVSSKYLHRDSQQYHTKKFSYRDQACPA